ncbi:MAG: polysaccharide pyruvyl transferase family protein [Planctomycetes bacterium]|nr:polysaccharide pyruvyl transferase family protein [Planctomycetota bacterium]MBI3843450.1 polysaccharide pyruvyl transferase family protein [Planctomycetota bacterium]
MRSSSSDRRRICLFGAAPDTGNLGVSALCLSAITAIARRLPQARLTVFDNGWGVRPASTSIDGRDFSYELCGARYSRRFYRPESFWNMRVCGWFGGLANAGARAVAEADVVLDASGGDSFTDLYGIDRFEAVVMPKRLALESRSSLVLLPQTYGPFSSDRIRRTAQRIVRSANTAWARDRQSFERLRELAGEDFAPDRHRSGVDVAFALEPRRPSTPLSQPIDSWLKSRLERGRRIAGFNVSGLIYNDPAGSARRYRLLADYRRAVTSFLVRLLEQSDVNVLLVPHVVTPPGHYESDVDACDDLCKLLAPYGRERLAVMPPLADPREAKWVISKLDWFCGTRMHATIAALSAGVPTSAIAYSSKALGVFETCGQGDRVADPRWLDTEEIIESLWCSWCERTATKERLAAAAPGIVRQAESQMDDILGVSRPLVESQEPNTNGNLRLRSTEPRSTAASF